MHLVRVRVWVRVRIRFGVGVRVGLGVGVGLGVRVGAKVRFSPVHLLGSATSRGADLAQAVRLVAVQSVLELDNGALFAAQLQVK